MKYRMLEARSILAVAMVGAVVSATQGQTVAPETPPPPPPRAQPEELSLTDANLFGASLVTDPRGNIVVSQVPPNTAAATAQLAQGDIIVQFAGIPVRTLSAMIDDAAKVTRTQRPGSKINLVVLRDGNQQKITLVMPAETERRTAPRVIVDPPPAYTDAAPGAVDIGAGNAAPAENLPIEERVRILEAKVKGLEQVIQGLAERLIALEGPGSGQPAPRAEQ